MFKTGSVLVTALTAAVMASWPADPAEAHGRAGFSRVSFGLGYGSPGFYRPFGYYGGFYYPRSYFGVSAWPSIRARRARQAERKEVRNKAVYVYPAEGQTEAEVSDDKYDCHVWAVDSTDFDPTLGAGTQEQADNYARAFSACLEGRGYVVR